MTTDISLNLPPIEAKIKLIDGKQAIWDSLRKKFVSLTPEEWVRQHFIRFLADFKGYPEALLGNEVGLCLNGTRKRCDSVIFGKTMEPLAIIEYKAPEVRITQKTFDQIVRYNMVLRARYLFVSNGMEHYCCEIDYGSGSYRFLRDIPSYDDLKK